MHTPLSLSSWYPANVAAPGALAMFLSVQTVKSDTGQHLQLFFNREASLCRAIISVEHSHFILFQSFLSVSYLTEGVEYMLDSKKRGSGLKGEKFGSGGNVSKF